MANPISIKDPKKPRLQNSGFILLEILLALTLLIISISLIQVYTQTLHLNFQNLHRLRSTLETTENQANGGPILFPESSQAISSNNRIIHILSTPTLEIDQVN